MKVMIVDDEPKVREGLKVIIPWEECGYTVAGTASNGLEALHLCAELEPDLVVADIRMPGMDGLTLIQRLRDRDAKLHILILSGHADFEYAQKAMATRADGYLLKPVDEDEMIAYLNKIRQEFEAKQQELENWSSAAGKWTKEQVILSLLEQPSAANRASLALQAQQLDLAWREYQVLLMEPYRLDGAGGDVGQFLEAMKRVADHFESGGWGVPFIQQGQYGVLLKQTFVGEQMRRELAEAIGRQLEGSGIQVIAAIGQLVRRLSDIWQSGEQASELLRQQFFAEQDGILSDEYTLRHTALEEPEQVEDRLYYMMELGDQTGLEPLIRAAGGWMSQSGATEQDIKRYFAELTTSLIERLSASHTALQGALKSHTDQIAMIYQQKTLLSLYGHVVSLLHDIMAPLGKRTQEHDLKAMLDLINRNYGDNLKLETLAGVFNYNPAYLGKMFKNTTGEYFNTYLDKVRIEHAKQFLLQGMKVYQVAGKVGYTNVDYFHGKFKKYVGVSPSSYKKGEQHVQGQIMT